MRKAKATGRSRPAGHAGEGAASALKEMLRRQAGNPAPGAGTSKPNERGAVRPEPRQPGNRPLH